MAKFPLKGKEGKKEEGKKHEAKESKPFEKKEKAAEGFKSGGKVKKC